MIDHHEHYHMPVRADQDPERAKEAEKVTWAGIAVNAFLAGGKLAAGLLGSSSAMVADAVHSLSDLATDGVALVSIRIAAHGADEKHPYGHGRAETIGAAIIGVALIFVGISLVADVVGKLVEGDLPTPTWPALAGAFVSIMLNEGLFQYSVRIGRRQQNETIIANAWHHRSDSLSSVAALLGIGGAMAGFTILDPLAAIVVVYMIVKVGWEIAETAIQELMDATAPPEKLSEIRKVMLGVSGVRRFHELRTRKVGADLFVDVHILVAPDISVSEAHNIAETVRAQLKEEAEVTDALVHTDAEDDIHYKLIRLDRSAIEKMVNKEAAATDGVVGAPETHMHILNGKLCVDLVVELEERVTFGQARENVADLKKRIMNHDDIAEVVIRAGLTEGVVESGFAEPADFHQARQEKEEAKKARKEGDL